jgi:excisionase family DNA binding protein
MAKMFYSLEEAAQKLGVSEDKVKEMAGSGTLQQFRDRDKVMFKVEQVDKLAASGGGGGGDQPAPSVVAPGLSDSASIPLADTAGGDTDAIDLNAAVEADHDKPRGQGTTSATGISVFDADEVQAADPLAQTVVSSSAGSDDDELALESVGSGSGLLDLTRESDDTSLGAELLEEIYPAGGSDAKVEGGSGFEGIFDAAGGVDSAPSGLTEAEATGAAATGGGSTVVLAEAADPAGSGWTAGMLVGGIAALIIGMMIVVACMVGTISGVATSFARDMPVWLGCIGAGTLIFAVVGGFIGSAAGR